MYHGVSLLPLVLGSSGLAPGHHPHPLESQFIAPNTTQGYHYLRISWSKEVWEEPSSFPHLPWTSVQVALHGFGFGRLTSVLCSLLWFWKTESCQQWPLEPRRTHRWSRCSAPGDVVPGSSSATRARDQNQSPTTAMQVAVLILTVGVFTIKSLLCAGRTKNSWLLEILPFRRNDIKFLRSLASLKVKGKSGGIQLFT